MTGRVGMHISRGEVRVVLVARGVVRWRSRLAIAEGAVLDDVVGHLLREVPWPRGMRRRVSMAIEPPYCRVRELEGLPASPAGTTTDAMTEHVRTNVDAFFPRIAGGAEIAPVWTAPDDRVYAAAMNRELLQRIETIARAAGCTVNAIAPSMSVLDCRSGCALAHRRSATELATLEQLDAEWRDAFVAAVEGARGPLAYASMFPFRWATFGRRLLSVLAGAAALASAFVAAGAPALRAAWTTRNLAPKVLASDADRRSSTPRRDGEYDAERLAADVRRDRAVIEAANHLRSSQGAMLSLLADVSKTLPDSTAIVSLHVDSLEGRLVAIAPSVVDVLPAIAAVRGTTAVRITGAVTHESTGGLSLERATVRFGRVATTSRATSGAPR